jgi:hypothetical protein
MASARRGQREQLATWTPTGWEPAPGWRFKPGSRTQFERIEEQVEVAEPAGDWWRRPYAGVEPPQGAKPGRPWYCPQEPSGAPGVWVDESGWRWPLSALPRGAQVPSQPSGDEPLSDLENVLKDVQRTYVAGAGDEE